MSITATTNTRANTNKEAMISTPPTAYAINNDFSTPSKNNIFKGWILAYQDVKTNTSVDNASTQAKLESVKYVDVKWSCKFAVVNKRHQMVILFDYEPSNDTIISTLRMLSENDRPQENYSHDVVYRLDNSVKYDSFINYWRTKASNVDDKFANDANLVINEMEKDSFSSNQNATTSSTNGTFKLAGLFFKKDKSDKMSKHSSLKRAKSGINIERKKTLNQVSDTNEKNNKNNILKSVDYDNRHSLPTPMRPSRSHESLASPLKSPINLNTTGSKNDNSFIRSSTMKSSKTYSSNVNTTPSSLSRETRLNNHSNHIYCNLVKLDLSNSAKVQINSIHNSLLSQENCFEIKCNSCIIDNICLESLEQENLNDFENMNNSNAQSDPFKSSNSTTSHQQGPLYFMCRSSEEREKWIQCLKNVSQPNLSNERHDENSLQVWILEAKGQQLNNSSKYNINKKYFCEILLNNQLSARTCLKAKKEILFWGESFEFNSIECSYLRVDLYEQVTNESQKKKSKKDKQSTLSNCFSSNQILIGYVNIPLVTIENNNSQPTEKWYKLDLPSTLSTSSSFQNNDTNIHENSAAATTTQNFGKDSLTIRIKTRYQSVDILPLQFYKRLIEYTRDNYLSLMLKLEAHLNVRVKDDLANSLVRIAHKLNIQTKFLSDLVLAEVFQSEDVSLTFRGNSLATKAMESYMKLVGEKYLKQTLCDCVRSIIETTHDLEIDPSKVANQSDLQSNRDELMQILHLVCGRIFNSCIYIPDEMKQVFGCLRAESKRKGKTDEMCDTLISASIFLRFICPAILSPNLFNLTQEYPQEKAARKLTLVAKTLQTIANFTKFGAKELYMSFEKMNTFVEEHTSMMREFLRNISTLSEQELMAIENAHVKEFSVFMLTPQTPNSINDSLIQSHYKKNDNLVNVELDLIDLGKQLSILHVQLELIFSNLNENAKEKFDKQIILILDEITRIKLISKSKFKAELECNQDKYQMYSFENKLHHEFIKNSNFSDDLVMVPLDQEQKRLSSSSNSSHYSSEMTLNIVNGQTIINHNLLENEINLLKQRLKETEINLKKEQTEKYLIEFKLKQQQQDNDQQMRNIINRLIKVEEELRKEQSEMHKILKAKQELIEIQKKKIEYLTKKSSKTKNPTNLINMIENDNIYFGTAPSPITTNFSANSQKVNVNMNQYPTNSNQLINTKPNQQISSSISNPSIYSKADIHLIKSPNTNSSSNINKDTHLNTTKFSPSIKGQMSREKPAIAASPSSSSSSMTQFCNYLSSNIITTVNNNNSSQNVNANNPVVNKNLKLNAPTTPRAELVNQKSMFHDQSVSSSSSSGSTTSTLSNLSSINNQNNLTYIPTSGHHYLRTSEL